MKLESEIQEWMVRLADKGGWAGWGNLYSAVRYDDSLLSQEMKNEVEDKLNDGLTPSRHRAVRDACRVLQSLVEYRFKSANTNISLDPGKILKPDLILEDTTSGAFVVVELKRSRKTAREIATELLAYANCLSEQYPSSQVFLVLISTSWAPLEQHAFAQLAQSHMPSLALEYREADSHELTPTLLVRSDLLPVSNARQFPPAALQVDTKVFFLPNNWYRTEHRCNSVGHAIKALVREAEKGRASGFVIVWSLPSESLSESPNGLRVKLFVSVAVRNPCRSQAIPVFKAEHEAQDFVFWSTPEEINDNTAVQLLLNFSIDKGIRSYSSEHEGTWNDLQARLDRENASIWHFEGFGEIGDQVSSWRTQKRYSLAPVLADITVLPTWHPLTWLPALESLIDTSEQEEENPLAWLAFRRGEDIGKFHSLRYTGCNARHFGWAVAQARFVRTWCDFSASNHEAPELVARISASQFRWDFSHRERAFKFAYDCVAAEGKLAHYCFALGFHVGSGCNNIEYLIDQWYTLQKDDIHLPTKLKAKIEDLEMCYGSNKRSL